MASHLTITSGTGATAATRTFGGQSAVHQDATTEAGGLLGIFGALLANNGAEASAQTRAANLGPEGVVPDVATLLAGIDISGDGEGDAAQDPEALAAAMDLSIAPTPPVEPQPMLDFVDALGALKASLDRGEPLDPELLAQVESALDGLAEALGLDLSTLPVPEDFAALLAETGDGTGLAGTLTALLQPLAQSFAGDTGEPGVDRSAVDAGLKNLSDKLGALLAALEDGAVPADKLAAIGMPTDAEPAAEIQDALARLAASLDEAIVPETPELAPPTLRLTEPVLTGRTTDPNALPESEPAPTSSAQSADAAIDGQNDRPDGNSNRPDRERPEPVRPARPQASAQATAVAADNSAVQTAQAAPAPDTGSPRADATSAVAPRVIQAGYQTSQQQLNLPQIAFELGRQVQDGNTRFQIRLDPPELGRIDVRLDIDSTGQVNARLTVEKSETLDLMQRDQRGLERALQQAGLDGAKTNLEFSLKQNNAGQTGQADRDGRNGNGGGDTGNGAGAEGEQALPTVNLYRGSLQATGINIIA